MKIRRIKNFIQWKAIPFIGDVIRNGFIAVAFLLCLILPFILFTYFYQLFGYIGLTFAFIIFFGVTMTIIQRSV